METEKKEEKPKTRPKLTRKEMIRIMSRYVLKKKQRPILPRTYINTRGLTTARLQPTATPADEKPIISNTVKARLQSDLQFLLQNQHTIDRRIQPAESYFSLQIDKRNLPSNQNGSGNQNQEKSNTHSSDLAPSSKSDHDNVEQQKLTTKSKRPTEKNEAKKSKLPPMEQAKNSRSDALKQKPVTMRSMEKETTKQSNDRLILVPYSSSGSKHSQAEAKLTSKTRKSKRRQDDSISLGPTSTEKKNSTHRPQKSKRVHPFSPSSFNDGLSFFNEIENKGRADFRSVSPSVAYSSRKFKNNNGSFADFPLQSNKSKRSSHSHQRSFSEFNEDFSDDLDTFEMDIRAGDGSAVLSLYLNSSKFSMERDQWEFDEPKFTEPSSVSSNRFEYRPPKHFGQRSNELTSREIEASESIESDRSGMKRTRVIRSSLSRVGERSPYMEQIVIQKMKRPY